MNDLDLLRRFEPVVRYTQGEQFFPTAVEGYLERASLWVAPPGSQPALVVAEGQLDPDQLVQYAEANVSARVYLRFTDTRLKVGDYQRWRFDRPAFRAPGRLTRVGLFARVIDSLFDVSLLVRGRVPGGATSIAAAKYGWAHEVDPRFVYYGRVVRSGGYIALNYWFFYAMNPWRSSFYGANDHEADWEQVFVYLSDEGDAEPVPRWVAYAQHDFAGDDLRRRWDDPELHRVGEHPVVFAGAGSHASYFVAGEYLMGVEPASLAPVRNFVRNVRQVWAERFGQGDTSMIEREVSALFSIPFVDYARGDGMRIGPDEVHTWSPVVLDDATPWAERYFGLWGLDTRDPFGGERAPSGPKYNRDGSVRASWLDPLGWAGLDKVSPPSAAAQDLHATIGRLETERQALAAQIAERRSSLRGLSLQRLALESCVPTRADTELSTAEAELHALAQRDSELAEHLLAARRYAQRLAHGEGDDPRAHIVHRHEPEPPLPGRALVVEVWAAISGVALIATLGMVLVFAPAGWPLWLACALGAMFLVEAAAQHQLVRVLLNLVIVLAIVAALILIKDFWQVAVIVGLTAVLLPLLIQNLSELRRT